MKNKLKNKLKKSNISVTVENYTNEMWIRLFNITESNCTLFQLAQKGFIRTMISRIITIK